MPMAEVEQFSYGVTNPILACVMAYVGCLLGLICAAHARTLPVGRPRARWLWASAAGIGGSGLWLMHMMAMLGFEVEGTTIRYNALLIIASLAIGVFVVAAGIFLVAYGKRSVPRLLVGGTLTGIGVTGQHLVGMAAVNINGSFTFNPRIMAVSVAISLVFSTTALWFTLAARRGVHFLAAALVMALAVTGTHYSAMVALGVDMSPMPHDVPGVEPTLFVLPILLLSIATLICLLFCGLNILGDEQFALRVDPAILAEPTPSQSPRRPGGRTTSQVARTSRPASHTGNPPPHDVYPSPRSGFEPAIGAGPMAGASPYRADRMRPSSLRALAGNTSELRVVGRDRDRLRRAPDDPAPSDNPPRRPGVVTRAELPADDD
jgi:NO-binding membrane sensor protein with MHYT domain